MINALVDEEKHTALVKFDQHDWDFIVKESAFTGQTLAEIIAVVFIEGRITVRKKGQ